MEIKERYCSFEVSKLLQEKGFDENVSGYYNIWDSKINPPVWGANTYRRSEAQHLYIKAPTHQMACDWVRGKGWYIEIPLSFDDDGNAVYSAIISSIDSFISARIGVFPSVEEATEEALKFVLTKLI